jgi:hypothetical protein
MNKENKSADRVFAKEEAKRKKLLKRKFESEQRKMRLLSQPGLPKRRHHKSLPGQLHLFE